MIPSSRRVVMKWLARRASYEEGGKFVGGWENGHVRHDHDRDEDMGDGSLFPPVRDSYGRPQDPPDVDGDVNLNDLAKKLAGSRK